MAFVHRHTLRCWHSSRQKIIYVTRSREWVTCRQYSILIFQYKSLVHLNCYILIQTPSQSDIWLQRYEQFFKFKNNAKHKNLSPLLACNSKSIFPTSDSFPLIKSHICKGRLSKTRPRGYFCHNFTGNGYILSFLDLYMYVFKLSQLNHWKPKW